MTRSSRLEEILKRGNHKEIIQEYPWLKRKNKKGNGQENKKYQRMICVQRWEILEESLYLSKTGLIGRLFYSNDSYLFI